MSASDLMPVARPFTGMTLDRVSAERKDPDWVSRLLDDPAARAVGATHDAVLMRVGDAPALVRAPLTPGQPPILLGLEDGRRPVFARDLEGAGTTEPAAADAAEPAAADTAESAAPGPKQADGAELVSLRDAGTVLPHSEAGLAAYVVALLNWHRRHGFCANCGAATDIAEAGYSRHCPRCGATHFPRTDPVVIMTVEHEGRLLLGRRAGWPAGRLSVLAGFVSPGESAEEAVVREVQEESGIVSYDPVFVTSQPWPFPASLMLGFHARSDGGDPRARDGELEEVHWLDADAVRRAMREEHPDFRLPPSISIARYLIERWAVLNEA